MITGTIYIDAKCDSCGKEERIDLSERHHVLDRWPPHNEVERIGWRNYWNPEARGEEQRYEHLCRPCWLAKDVVDAEKRLRQARDSMQREQEKECA